MLPQLKARGFDGFKFYIFIVSFYLLITISWVPEFQLITPIEGFWDFIKKEVTDFLIRFYTGLAFWAFSLFTGEVILEKGSKGSEPESLFIKILELGFMIYIVIAYIAFMIWLFNPRYLLSFF